MLIWLLQLQIFVLLVRLAKLAIWPFLLILLMHVFANLGGAVYDVDGDSDVASSIILCS